MTSSKVCRKCGQSKPVSCFYKHPKMADGFLNICKDCTKERVAKHRDKNLDRIREYDRTRGKQKERIAASAAISNRWRNRDSRIVAAHNKVAREIKAGNLVRLPCSVCGSISSYAHHESYNRPLDVVWLCQIHHKARHKQMAIDGIDPLILIDDEI